LARKYNITGILRRVTKPDGSVAYYAAVEHGDPIFVSDICDRLDDTDGMKLKAATQVLLEVMDDVLNGELVDMGAYTVELAVRGEFEGGGDVFDRERHKLSLKITPKESLIKRFDKVSVGVKVNDNPCTISNLKISRSNFLPGAVRPGDILIVEGCGLLIQGKGEEIGAWLVGADRTCRIKMTEYIVPPTEKRLEIVIPEDTPSGRYYVKIVTMYDDLDGVAKGEPHDAISTKAIYVERRM